LAVAGAQSVTNSRATLSSDQFQILLLTPNGPRSAVLGEGWVVTAQPGKLIVSPQPAPRVRHIPVTVAADGSVTAPGLITLARNGIVLTEFIDYVRTPTGAQLTAQGFEAGENWSAFVQ
jgi:hypothetical protein